MTGVSVRRVIRVEHPGKHLKNIRFPRTVCEVIVPRLESYWHPRADFPWLDHIPGSDYGSPYRSKPRCTGTQTKRTLWTAILALAIMGIEKISQSSLKASEIKTAFRTGSSERRR